MKKKLIIFQMFLKLFSSQNFNDQNRRIIYLPHFL